MGDNFNNDETYKYILEYGNYIENTEFYTRNYEIELNTGQVKGSVLNTIGLLFKVNNHKKYENPTYKLTIKIKGEDLNNGTVKIHFKDKIDKKASSYNFYVMRDLKNAFLENVAIQGGFDVIFVDSKDLFPNLTKYYVDNISDLIKNISKNTSVEDFTKNIDVKDNGKVKIYDTTGTTEITGNVGTGMIARVINEYDENILDLDVVVKGDVSGDGNISITDLVKVKRHLSEDEELTGVYEVAGNITDTGEIGITDLVKISRDVAKIQEVQ